VFYVANIRHKFEIAIAFHIIFVLKISIQAVRIEIKLLEMDKIRRKISLTLYCYLVLNRNNTVDIQQIKTELKIYFFLMLCFLYSIVILVNESRTI